MKMHNQRPNRFPPNIAVSHLRTLLDSLILKIISFYFNITPNMVKLESILYATKAIQATELKSVFSGVRVMRYGGCYHGGVAHKMDTMLGAMLK